MSAVKDGGAVFIHIEDGISAIISAHDADRVSSYSWRIGSNGYVYCRNRSAVKEVLLHRFVAEPESGMQVHHLNGIKTDCRRENLVIESASDHQTRHHSHVLTKRNLESRIYPSSRSCAGCGVVFVVHPDHRGRNRYCSRDCGNKNRNALRAREVQS